MESKEIILYRLNELGFINFFTRKDIDNVLIYHLIYKWNSLKIIKT